MSHIHSLCHLVIALFCAHLPQPSHCILGLVLPRNVGFGMPFAAFPAATRLSRFWVAASDIFFFASSDRLRPVRANAEFRAAMGDFLLPLAAALCFALVSAEATLPLLCYMAASIRASSLPI